VNIATEDSDETMLAMNEALEALARESPQKAEIVKLRYFTGLENKEIAQALGISLSTVERSWAYARSWLHREMKKNSATR
jgi:RNA polymerase sigma factor (sigma-70 family)